MAITMFSDMNDMQRSVLQEICNMGAGSAATAVSEIVSSPTDISTPQVKVITPLLATKLADTLTKGALAYMIRLQDEFSAMMLFVFPFQYIERAMKDIIPGFEVSGPESINAIAGSMLGEIVKQTALSYANSVAMMSGLNVEISAPESVKKPSDALNAKLDPSMPICSVTNTIEILDCHRAYTSIFYPEFDSAMKVMEALGML